MITVTALIARRINTVYYSDYCYFSRRAPGRKIIASDFAPRVLALRARAPSRRAPGLKIIASDFEPRVLALRARAPP